MSKWNQRCWYEYIVSGHKWTTHAIAGNSPPLPQLSFSVCSNWNVWWKATSLYGFSRLHCVPQTDVEHEYSSNLEYPRFCLSLEYAIERLSYHQPTDIQCISMSFSLNKRQQLLLSLRFSFFEICKWWLYSNIKEYLSKINKGCCTVGYILKEK